MTDVSAETVRPPRSRLLLVVVPVLILGALGLGTVRTGPGLGTVSGVVVRAFDDSRAVALDDFRGRPLVVNTWASWCPPCVEEMSDFQSVYLDVSSRVEFLGLNVRDGPGPARRLVDSTGVTYPLAADPDASAYTKLGARGMPTTVFVDAGGRIVHRHTGSMKADRLRELIEEHLGV